jgi:hypothetical protein
MKKRIVLKIMFKMIEFITFLEKDLKIIGSLFCRTILQIKNKSLNLKLLPFNFPPFPLILINTLRFNQCHHFMYNIRVFVLINQYWTELFICCYSVRRKTQLHKISLHHFNYRKRPYHYLHCTCLSWCEWHSGRTIASSSHGRWFKSHYRW